MLILECKRVLMDMDAVEVRQAGFLGMAGQEGDGMRRKGLNKDGI